MEDVFEALNELVAQGVLASYAIGGAVAAAFYVEALQTEDVDAFVLLSVTANGLLSLQPIYEALVAQGGVIEGAHIRFGAWPLQILPDSNALIHDAIEMAVATPFGNVETRIFRAEHLFAIALQTGRAKDYLRAGLLLETGAVTRASVQPLLERHGLTARLRGVPNGE